MIEIELKARELLVAEYERDGICPVPIVHDSLFNAALRAIARALQAQPAEGGVAEGFVLVPVEPTEAMLLEGARSLIDGMVDRPGSSWAEESGLAYAAMLAAAPKPATTTGEGVEGE